MDDSGSRAPDTRALAAELARGIAGEVRFDGGSRALYATDASNYRQTPIGVVLPRTRSRVVSIIEELWDAGAGGVLLGCTELELLVKQADVEIPVFPCTTLHVQAALDMALA